jgi:hypothetical protein
MDALQQELTKLAETDFFQLAKREPNSRTRIRLLALGDDDVDLTDLKVPIFWKSLVNLLKGLV